MAIDLREIFKNDYVLVIEDMTSMRRTIRSMLKQVGVNNAMEADDGDTALQVLMTHPNCGFILVDWNMPRMPGIEVIREMRSKAAIQDIPMVMITAEMGRDEVVQAAEAGVNGYIVKPFVAKTLEEKIISVMASRANPPEHVRLIKEGEDAVLRGEYQRALECFEAAKTARESARVYVNIGEAHELVGNNPMAHNAYNAAIGINPMFLKAHVRSGNLHMREGNHDAALAAFMKAVEISPNNPERHIIIGKILVAKGNTAQAHAAFTQAVKKDANKATEIAEELMKMGRADMAEHFFRAILIRNADSVHLYNRLGIALRRQGKWQEAIQEYETAVKIDPKDAGIHFNMGKAYLEGKRTREAIHCFRKALELEPSMKEAQNELSGLERGRGWD